MKPLRYAGVDHKAYVLVIGYFVVILLCRFFYRFRSKVSYDAEIFAVPAG